MTEQSSKKALKDEKNWKNLARWSSHGYYKLETEDTCDVPVRIFMTESLFEEAETIIYQQIVNATRFPGVKAVIITPDAHYGYGVPVGCVLITDYDTGSIAMGPVGYDIGCGMMSAKSSVCVTEATPEKRMKFNQEVMRRVAMGAGGKSRKLGNITESEFTELVHGGAEYYVSKYGATFDRSCAERQRIPVDSKWQIPKGGKGVPERGMNQIGTLGGGNHFIELQHETLTDKLYIQVHTGSRGFGHGLATNYFELARAEKPDVVKDIDLGYFLPSSPHYESYLNAVAAGGNYAIINRLVIFEEVAEAFRAVFDSDLELVYEISHNLVQKEWNPEFGEVWVHRKGATRAFPPGHPGLKGTRWENTGHPVLVPGSNRSFSYILRPLPDSQKSGFSVNHGAGRRMSRAKAAKELSQEKVDREYQEAGILVNTDGHVPIDESVAAYKSSEEVLQAILNANLAEIECKLFPLASLKGTEESKFAKRKKAKAMANSNS